MTIKYQVGIKLGQRYAGTPTIVRTYTGMPCEMHPSERGGLSFFSGPSVVLCRIAAWNTASDTQRTDVSFWNVLNLYIYIFDYVF